MAYEEEPSSKENFYTPEEKNRRREGKRCVKTYSPLCSASLTTPLK